MNKTIIYLIRHSEQLKLNFYDKIEDEQIRNEKIILSVKGEEKAEQLSRLQELNDIDIIYCSNYVRAISTAKYIAEKNNLSINIDTNFNERKLGDLKFLKELGKNSKHPFATEQLIDKDLKNIDGENRAEVTKRMLKSFNNALIENKGKKIAIISHGAAIKFLLLTWCKLTPKYQIEYNNEIIEINSPSVIKIIFDDDKLIDLKQVNTSTN